jgi:uncharacterized membrane protein AbrB (regulator of aidB expression)
LAVLVPWFLRHVGYDRATAFFSALPAGLTEMTAVGSDNGGNPQTIALTHTVRVLIVAFAIPFLLVVLAGYERPASDERMALVAISNMDLGLLAACCFIGLWLGHNRHVVRTKGPKQPIELEILRVSLNSLSSEQFDPRVRV